MPKTQFLTKYNNAYTIRRALKGYTGEHPNVIHWHPVEVAGEFVYDLERMDAERLEHEFSKEKLQAILQAIGSRYGSGGKYGKKDEKAQLAKKLHKLVQRLQAPLWHQSCRELVNAVNAAIANLKAGGYRRSTLRQLYYQLVAKNLIPNHQTVYDVLGEVITAAKYAGVIDWDALEDRNRGTKVAPYESSVEAALEEVAESFRLDRQKGQPVEIHVMAEKDAVSNIISPACYDYTVRFTIMKGYGSSSMFYSLYNFFKYDISDGKQVRILYLGDHDPSGLDMVRDIQVRLSHMICTGGYINLRRVYREAPEELMAEHGEGNVFEEYLPEEGDVYCVNDFSEPEGGKREERTVFFETYAEACAAAYIYHYLLRVVPIALTMEQVRELNLPPNPAKIQDSRAKKYIAEHGRESWELDAIPHGDLDKLIRSEIEKLMNMETYREVLAKEAKEKARILSIVEDQEEEDDENWEDDE